MLTVSFQRSAGMFGPFSVGKMRQTDGSVLTNFLELMQSQYGLVVKEKVTLSWWVLCDRSPPRMQHAPYWHSYISTGNLVKIGLGEIHHHQKLWDNSIISVYLCYWEQSTSDRSEQQSLHWICFLGWVGGGLYFNCSLFGGHQPGV